MYCKYCGAEIDNDSAICPNCGHDLTSIGTTKTQAVNTNDLIIAEDNKDWVLNKISDAHQLILETYYRYQDAQKIWDAFQERVSKRRALYESLGGICFWGIIIACGLIYFDIYYLVEGLSIEAIHIVFAVVAVIMLWGGIYVLSGPIHLRFVKKGVDAEMQEIFDKADKNFYDNIEKVSFLDEQYWTPVATDYLYKVIENGRANTWHTALDMCDLYLYKSQANTQHQEQLEALKNIYDAARSARRY